MQDTATVHARFSTLAACWPEYPAIRSDAGEISYAELERQANTLANHLQQVAGVQRGERVGLCLDRSPALLLAQLAILKLGAVYIPLDPRAPAERQQFIARDVGMRVLLTQAAMAGAGWPEDLRLVVLSEALLAGNAEPVPDRSSSADTAYIMYTSGSTGRPKGVEITHGGIVNLVTGQDYFPAGPGQCSLLLGSPAFDGATYEIWAALLTGGCCAIFADVDMSHRRLGETIRQFGVTSMFITTGLFNRIIDRDPQVLAGAAFIMVGGEALSPVHMQRAIALLPHVSFANGYGPTECTALTVCGPVSAEDAQGSSVPLGRPINNVVCHIVDEQLRPIAAGEIGELLIGGAGVGGGYINLPEQSAASFVADTISGEPGARLYRTGDLCRWLPDGRLAYIGRRDEQVKIRGFRIELGEVETALRKCAGVQNAAAVVWTFRSGARGIIGCIVMNPAAPHSDDMERTLLADLETMLPAPMIPHRLWLLNELPLNKNGKVDRQALVQQFGDHLLSRSTSSAVTGINTTEQRLLDLWQQLLKDPALTLDCDFFAYGGDSLLAAELTVMLELAFARSVPSGTIHRFCTPRSLAAWLSEPDGAAHAMQADGLRPQGWGPGAPVIYMPSVDGFGLMPASLAKALEGKHPYCDRLVIERGHGELSMQQIAADLLRQARQAFPSGPYILVGFSYGGVLAYEMACLLEAAGEPVEKLVLWDATPMPHAEILSRWESLVLALRLLADVRTRAGRIVIRRKWRSLLGRLRNAHKKEKLADENLPEYQRYIPGSYTGQIHLIACLREQGLRRRMPSAREAWERYRRPEQIIMHDIPCRHLELITEPHVHAAVAATLTFL